MPFNPLPGLVVVTGGLFVSGAVYRFGGRQGKYYAVPVLGAILIVGLWFVYDIPDYAFLLGIFLAPLVYHRSVKSKLFSAAAAVKELKVEEIGVALTWVQDHGLHAGLWQAKALDGAVPDLQPIVARPEFLKKEDDAAKPATLRVALDFKGEMDDDYEVLLYGDAPKHLPGELVVFNKDAIGWFTGVLAGNDAVEGLPGMEPWMLVRTLPFDYALRLLDIQAFSLLHELFAFETEERQLYVTVKGATICIGATRTFTAKELPRFLGVGSRVIQKVRQTDWGR